MLTLSHVLAAEESGTAAYRWHDLENRRRQDYVNRLYGDAIRPGRLAFETFARELLAEIHRDDPQAAITHKDFGAFLTFKLHGLAIPRKHVPFVPELTICRATGRFATRKGGPQMPWMQLGPNADVPHWTLRRWQLPKNATPALIWQRARRHLYLQQATRPLLLAA